ncbi:MAG: hypothetical protein MPJ06_08280 [Nitrosopumilus sp.]|nr:hypothetical protein [Nitrosopumilus sp.]MDA7943977.1 hypothetical protein [Nitrosopumilus sp.]MDA7955343.1 hypothetical protein [Nitrosopumilus sp.]
MQTCTSCNAAMPVDQQYCGSCGARAGSTPQDAHNDYVPLDEEPVSRFWACVFANGIFALFWTLKIRKTLLWLGLSVLTYVLTIAAFAIVPYSGIAIIYIASFVIPIYFMFRWTTEFNTRIFGYTSRKKWRRAGSPPPLPKSQWF